MANEQSNDTHPGHEATHSADGVVPSSVIPPNTTLKEPDTCDDHGFRPARPADPSSSSAPGTEGSGPDSPAQPHASPSPLLWATREGRIAGYRRLIETNQKPEHRANFEALIKYFEDGGKVPEGDEEVWAFDGQASFGIRSYTHINQMPDGWLHKPRWCGSSKWRQDSLILESHEYRITDTDGKVVQWGVQEYFKGVIMA